MQEIGFDHHRIDRKPDKIETEIAETADFGVGHDGEIALEGRPQIPPVSGRVAAGEAHQTGEVDAAFEHRNVDGGGFIDGCALLHRRGGRRWLDIALRSGGGAPGAGVWRGRKQREADCAQRQDCRERDQEIAPDARVPACSHAVVLVRASTSLQYREMIACGSKRACSSPALLLIAVLKSLLRT